MNLAFKHAIAAIILMLSIAAPVAANPFADAFAARDRGDYATALRLFAPYAHQGNALAQFNLGVMHANGQGVPQNDAAAAMWYRPAADRGHTAAQYNLGIMYANGRGVPQDYIQAYKWLSLSAVHGYQGAVENRDKAARLMTPAQIAEAQKLAREWKPTKQRPRGGKK